MRGDGTTTLAVSIGDVTGVGPEVTLKALAAEWAADRTRYRLFGDVAHLRWLGRRLGLTLSLEPESGEDPGARICVASPADGAAPGVLSLGEGSVLPAGAEVAARAAVAWLAAGARRCLQGEADALVTAPVNKAAICRSGLPFVGQTEFLSELAGTGRSIMMLLGADDRGHGLRVALATTHVPLRLVAEQLSPEKILLAIELAAKACGDLDLPRARIGVCGLNPHAGESGHLGSEEQTIILPAVHTAQQKGLDVVGPLAADTVFHYAYRGDYDAVVAMYHDQGLAPLKMIGFDSGVNWTLGLPFIRTSPDHGTAYDIAGRGVANPSSMVAAIQLAKRLARRRSAQNAS